jgi:hypothetical protein
VQAAAFISSLSHVTDTTKSSCASSLAATARRLGTPTPLLSLLQFALNASASTIPTRQAVPATSRHIFVLVNSALHNDDSNLAVAIWLCWKTASRWSDLMMLKRHNFLEVNQQQQRIVIRWAETKTNRTQSFRPDSWTVVVEADPQPAWMFELARRTINALPPNLFFTTTTTEQMRRFMRSLPQTVSLTAHSIKRGAVNALVEAAVDGRLDPRLIPLLAKHKDVANQFPATTLRYASDQVSLALMLGTQHATTLL